MVTIKHTRVSDVRPRGLGSHCCCGRKYAAVAAAVAATWGQPLVACAEKVCRGGSSGSGILGSACDSGSVGSSRTAIAMGMAQRQRQWWQRWWQVRMWARGVGGKSLFMETRGHREVYTTIKWSDVG